MEFEFFSPGASSQWNLSFSPLGLVADLSPLGLVAGLTITTSKRLAPATTINIIKFKGVFSVILTNSLDSSVNRHPGLQCGSDR